MSTPTDPRVVPPEERSVLGHRRGLPWWGAVLVAFGTTGLGIATNLLLADSLTWLYLVFYVVGCVAAVLAVAHRSLFTAIVQPPLVLAVAVPVVAGALGAGGGGGLRNAVLELVLPLVNGFPTMALTTVATVALGLVRLRRPHHAEHRSTPNGRSAPPARPTPAQGAQGDGPAGRRRPQPGRQPDRTPRS